MSIFKQLLVLCVLVGIGYAGYAAYLWYDPQDSKASGRPPPRPATVELATAEVRVMAATVEAVGTTRARHSVAIVPEADGRVIELAIQSGQTVAKGDVLVRMDDAIEAADLAEAKARVVEQSQALARMERLRTSNAVSQAALEETTARLAEARAQLDRAEQRFARRTITAPFDGVVGLSEIDPGARVEKGDVITTLDDLGEVMVEFGLPETLFASVMVGQNVIAHSAAFPGREFIGRIKAVDTRIDPIGRSFRTRAVIPNPDRILPAGMFMSLTVTLSEAEEVVVPEAAIVFQAAQAYVFSVKDGLATRLRVKPASRGEGFVAITEGVDAGTRVVIRGLQRVRDGAPVTLLEGNQTPDETAGEGDS